MGRTSSISPGGELFGLAMPPGDVRINRRLREPSLSFINTWRGETRARGLKACSAKTSDAGEPAKRAVNDGTGTRNGSGAEKTESITSAGISRQAMNRRRGFDQWGLVVPIPIV